MREMNERKRRGGEGNGRKRDEGNEMTAAELRETPIWQLTSTLPAKAFKELLYI